MGWGLKKKMIKWNERRNLGVENFKEFNFFYNTKLKYINHNYLSIILYKNPFSLFYDLSQNPFISSTPNFQTFPKY
jgi:hypothetical protein